MQTIDINNNYSVQIIFDKILTMETTGNFFEIIHKIEGCFQNYPFKDATVRNRENGNVILQLKNFS